MPDPNWNRADSDERPMRNRSYWIWSMASGPVAIAFYGRSDDPGLGPSGSITTWRFITDQLPVDPPPTHWAEIDVPAHPETP